jgi:hypothetical protein
MMTDKSPKEEMSRDELQTVLRLAVIVVVMLVGRQIGETYGGFEEVKSLEIRVNVEEEALASYLRDNVAGNDADLKIGFGIIIPGAVYDEGKLVQIPDYVKRWSIAVTLSPTTFQQPEVSDFEVNLLIEGEIAAEQTFTFPRAKVGFFSTLDREINLQVTDKENLLKLITSSATEHGGETQVTLKGQCRANYSFLETWLPFTVTKYPFVSTPLLNIDSLSWRDENNSPTTTIFTGQPGYAVIDFSNPARIHSISDTITCVITRENDSTPVTTITKTISVAPQSKATLFFPFIFTEIGVYSFTYSSNAGINLPIGQSPILTVQSIG